MRLFDQSNDGETVSIILGEEFEIRLDENPTAGFRWALETAPLVDVLGDEYVAPAPDKMGAPGRHVWRVRASRAGECRLTFRYARPWQPTSGEERRFSLELKIS